VVGHLHRLRFLTRKFSIQTLEPFSPGFFFFPVVFRLVAGQRQQPLIRTDFWILHHLSESTIESWSLHILIPLLALAEIVKDQAPSFRIKLMFALVLSGGR